METIIKTKKFIIAGIYYNSNGYHISINRMYMAKDSFKELENKFVGSIKDVAALLQKYEVSVATIDAMYPNKEEIKALQDLNEYTKRVVYAVLFIKGQQMFVVDKKHRVIHVGFTKSFYAGLASYTQIASILYKDYIK